MVALGDQVVEVLVLAGLERFEAEVVDDQQRHADQCLELAGAVTGGCVVAWATCATGQLGLTGREQDSWSHPFRLPARQGGVEWVAAGGPGHGFTGHEMVDAVGIIHMGGRIYDPRLGRFLQADPFVQAPDNSQNLNRYSYVLNNPLSFTDPTGFFFGGLFKGIFKNAVNLLQFKIGVFLRNLLPDTLANNPFIRFAIQYTVQLVSGAVQSAFNKNPLQFASLSSNSAGIGLDPRAFRIIEGPRDDDPLDSQIVNQRDRTRVAVLGGTASEITGNKFANGGDTEAFAFAEGILKFIGTTLGDAGIERGRQDALVRQLDPFDNAGRSAIKEASRARTPFLVRDFIETARPGTDARPGSIGSTNKPNAGFSRAGTVFRAIGKASVVFSLTVDATRVFTSSDRARTLFQVSVGTLGAIGGGALSAFGGSFVTPIAGTIAGGIAGSALGGAAGEAIGGRIFDAIFRREDEF